MAIFEFLKSGRHSILYSFSVEPLYSCHAAAAFCRLHGPRFRGLLLDLFPQPFHHRPEFRHFIAQARHFGRGPSASCGERAGIIGGGNGRCAHWPAEEVHPAMFARAWLFRQFDDQRAGGLGRPSRSR